MLYMKSKIAEVHPQEVSAIAVQLGDRIRIARRRRRLRQEDLAAKTGLSRSTIQSIERGAVTCSFGSVLHVLWVLGLSREVALIGAPGLDEQGLALEISGQGHRVRVAREIDNDF